MAGKGKKFPVENASWLEQVFDMVAARNMEQKPLALTIPDTVVFRYQRPAALYQNDSMEEHQISCRDDLGELSADSLCHRFVPRKGSPDSVCALYVYIDRQHEGADESKKASEKSQNVVVEYMNPPQLRHFLQHRTKENNGILQRFLPNKGASHATIQVIWTPRTCQVETRSNRQKMHDSKLPITDRLATFDGAPHLSTSHSLKDGLFYRNIKEAADNIVAHIETLISRPYQVWETILYFKYCAQEHGSSDKAGLTFLWCSSMRVFKDELLDLRRLDQFWTSELKPEVMTNKEAPDKNFKVLRCPISGEAYKDGTGSEVKVATIIKYMTILEHMYPSAQGTLKFKQQAAELDEQSSSKDAVGGRGTSKNAGEEAIKEIISNMMEKKTAARDACDLIKRVLFGDPEAPGAAQNRTIFNHEKFRNQTITVSEDAALDSARVVERDSVRTKAKSTHANEASRILARGIKKHMKRAPGSAFMMPASVVEVKSIVVGPEVMNVPSSKRSMRQMSAKSPSLSNEGVSGMLRNSVVNGNTLISVGDVNETEWVHNRGALFQNVDLGLGKSKILSFRRLKYRPLGASAANAPLVASELDTQDTAVNRKPRSAEEQDQTFGGKGDMSWISGSKNVQGATLYSKLNAARHAKPVDVESTDGALDDSVVSKESIPLNDARNKVLDQYAAFHSSTAADAKAEEEQVARQVMQQPDYSRTQQIIVPIDRRAQRALVERPYSEYKPRERNHTATTGHVFFSGQHQRDAASRPASAFIKQHKVLDREWSAGMRAQRQPLSTHVPRDTLASGHERIYGGAPDLSNRGLSAKGSGRMTSADRRMRAMESSSSGTRVSSASAGRPRRDRPGGSHFQLHDDGWSDGDLLDDDDEEEWDDGLEMDLPSTHLRLQREKEARDSRQAERMLRRSGEGICGAKGARQGGGHDANMPLCLQWGLDERVRDKVLEQYAFVN
jgi:hypothetical protein